MKFTNLTGERIRARVGNQHDCYWVNIDHKQTIDLPKTYGDNLGLTPVSEDPKTPSKDKTVTTDITFAQKLQKIKGVGPKTVKDILSRYPTEESLLEGIKKGYHIPGRDDIVEKLKKNLM